MSIKLGLTNKGDRPNLMYHVMVLHMLKAIGRTVTTYNNTFPFQTSQVGTTGNNMILLLDQHHGIKTYYDKVITLDHGSVSSGFLKEKHTMLKIWLKCKNARPVVYNQDTANIVNRPLLLYVIPYDSYDTLITDNMASYSYYTHMYYKDI